MWTWAESSVHICLYSCGRVSSVYTLVAESSLWYTLGVRVSAVYTLVAESSLCYTLGVRVSAVYTLVAESHLFILLWRSLPSVILLGLEYQLFIRLWRSLICIYSGGRVFPVLYSCGGVSSVYTLVAESSQCYTLGVRVSTVYTLVAESQLFILWWPSLPWFILVGVESCIRLYSCDRDIWTACVWWSIVPL